MSFLLRSLLAKREYSDLHYFLMKPGEMDRENQTPKNLKDSFGAIGVIVNCRVASTINVCAEGEEPKDL